MPDNWFDLTLDTYNPQLTLATPPYALTDGVLDVLVKADWPLDPYWLQVELTDALGRKTSHIFSYDEEDNSWIGIISCVGLPPGIATLRVQGRSDVWNLTNLATATVLIRAASTPVRLTSIEIVSRSVTMEVAERTVYTETAVRDVVTEILAATATDTEGA